MANTNLKAYLALLVGLAAISFGAIFARWAALPGVVAGFYRQFIMFIALTPFFALRLRRARRAGPSITRRAVRLSLLAGLFFAADLAFWLTALNHTSAANSVLLANTAPLYVGLGAMLLFNERLGTAFWPGLAVALSGSALIVSHDLRMSSSVGLGDLLALAAGLTYGFYQLTISRARRGIDALSSTWVTSISGGLVLFALSVGLRQSLAGFAPRQWLALAALGLISQTIGWVTINYSYNNPINLTDPSGLKPIWCKLFPRHPGCQDEDQTPTFEDTPIIEMPWVDEMHQESWQLYPNSCGAAALFMFLRGEGIVDVNYHTLVDQLKRERPGGYDPYCGTDGTSPSYQGIPTPTADPFGWNNPGCVSAEALAEVARNDYNMMIDSRDNWTKQEVYNKLMAGHPVLALVRVNLSTDQFGHFVVIRGLVDNGERVIFNDSFPNNRQTTRNASPERRSRMGEGRQEDWTDFDASWASDVDEKYDPLSPQGHVRWAMAAQ